MANAAEEQIALLAKQNILVSRQNVLVREQNDLFWNQNLIVGVEGLLLLFALVASAWAARAASQAVQVARENAHMELRAFISAGNHSLSVGVPQMLLSSGFTLTNSGKTPALQVTHYSVIAILPFPLPPGFPFPLGGDVSAAMDLAAGVSVEGRNDTMQQLPEAGRVAIAAGTHRIYVFGLLQYRDVFDVPQFTQFCVSFTESAALIDPSGEPRVVKNLVVQFSPEHNRTSLNRPQTTPSYFHRTGTWLSQQWQRRRAT